MVRDHCGEAGAEYASLARRCGIEVPEDLAGGVVAGYASLRGMMELLRAADPAGAGPAAGRAAGSGAPDA